MQEKPECTAIIVSLNKLQEIIVQNGDGIFSLSETIYQNIKTKLERLSSAVDEYSKKDGNLTYIGFMGHYSSGKSSSINSIFEFDEDEKRNVGHNPTDKQITLITSKNNEDKLFQMVREGQIPVRSIFVKNESLKNIVIIDTPGSGDPGIASELVQDFLPICDVLFYVISCANPLDSSDLPLLVEKQDKLPFIPMHFILTRADEFKLNPDDKLEESNFDNSSYVSFLAELKSRIESQITSNLNQDDFYAVDNRTGFKKEILVSKIDEYSKTSNSQAIANHSHKVNYFKSVSDELRKKLLTEINSKIKNLESLLSEAKSRIADYDEAVNIKNNDLTSTWSLRLDRINNTYNKLVTRAGKEESKLVLTDSFWAVSEYTKWSASISQSIQREAEHNSKKILETLEKKFRSEITDRFKDKLEAIQDFSQLNGLENELVPPIDDLPLKLDSYEKVLLSHSLNFQVSSFWSTVERILKGQNTSVSNNLTTLLKRIDQKHPLATFTSEVEDTKKSLESDIDTFLQIVKLYRAGVLTNQAKQYIAKLNLGETLDEYDTELPSEEVTRIKNEAFVKFCPQFEELSNSFNTNIKSSRAKVKTAIDDLPSSITITSPFQRDDIFESIDSTSIVNECKSEIFDSYYSQLKPKIDVFSEEIKSLFKRHKKAYTDSLKRKDDDFKSLVKLVIGFFFLVMLGVSVYLYGDENIPSNWKFWIISVVVGVWVGDFWKGFLHKPFLKLFNRSKENNERMCFEDFINGFTADYDSKIDKLDEQIKIDDIKSEMLTNKISSNWKDQFSKFKETEEAIRGVDYYNTIKKSNDTYGVSLAEYLEHSKTIYSSISSYYNDVTKNLEILKNTSSHIKEISIEPSFKFLETMMDKLGEIERSIKDVTF